MHPAHALGRRITYHPTNLRTLLDSFSSWPRKISANHTPSSHLLQPTSRSLHPSPSTLNTNPLPSSIREAWNAGLSGTHPNQYSRLRAKATTITYPDPPPAISSTPTPSQQTSASTEQNTSVPCHSSLQPKRTLLQTYLSWVFPLCTFITRLSFQTPPISIEW